MDHISPGNNYTYVYGASWRKPVHFSQTGSSTCFCPPCWYVSVLVFLVHTALSGSSGRVWGLCLIKQWLRPLAWTVMSYLVAFLKTPIFTCCFFYAFLSSFWSSVSCFTSRTSSCFRKIILSQMNLHLRLNRLWFAYRFYFYLIVAVKFYLSNTFFPQTSMFTYGWLKGY